MDAPAGIFIFIPFSFSTLGARERASEVGAGLYSGQRCRTMEGVLGGVCVWRLDWMGFGGVCGKLDWMGFGGVCVCMET